MRWNWTLCVDAHDIEYFQKQATLKTNVCKWLTDSSDGLVNERKVEYLQLKNSSLGKLAAGYSYLKSRK